MLQQTRVETVLNYYERFLRRFPDERTLARAPREAVLKHWEGLGYYRRVVHLHEAAKQLAAAGAPIPSSARELRRLPGVGPYLAAAIASIAFGERAAAVDGNVARVLSRLMGVRDDVQSVTGRRAIQSIADQLVPRGRPGDFNQAWMDLGSVVCRPRSPDCDVCPLSGECVALACGATNDLPVRNGRPKVAKVRCITAVFVDRGRWLVRRRPDTGLWSGLWEFPTTELESATTSRPSKTAKQSDPRDSIHTLAVDHGAKPTAAAEHVASVSHRLTHRAITFEVYKCTARPTRNGTAEPPTRWVTPRGFARLSVSTAHRRICAAAL
jgi:A/G-specific adenine glycosylase